jgi:hypothetical protein
MIGAISAGPAAPTTTAIVGRDPSARVLILFVPGGQEGAFDDLAALAAEIGGPPDHDDERVQAIAARYDSVFVGPPL